MPLSRRSPTITAAELKEILLSPGYKHEVAAISSYLASTAQERPLVYCLAKHLWIRGHQAFQLEADHVDIEVNRRRIEFKFNYDCNIEVLENELCRIGDRSIQNVCEDDLDARVSKGWGVLLKIYEDICRKKPDLFVWIICARDLRRIADEDLHRIRWWSQQRKYNGKHAYGDRHFLSVVDGLLESLKTIGGYTFSGGEFETTGLFPSTYHFRICDFATTTGSGKVPPGPDSD